MPDKWWVRADGRVVQTGHMLRGNLGPRPWAFEADASPEGGQGPWVQLGSQLPQGWTVKVYFGGG